MPIPLLALIAAGMAGTTAVGSAVGAVRRDGKARNPLEDDAEAQTIDDGPSSLFMSGLEAVGRPGHILSNLAVGNWEGAGRQTVDLLGDIVDAPLPGDWIKPISRRMDKPGFSDVLGGMDPGLAKTAVDVVGGIATDPTNLIPGAAIGKGLKIGGDAVKGAIKGASPQLAKSLEKGALATKETLGWLNPSEPIKKTLAAATALRGRATKAGSAEAERIMAAMPESMQDMVGDVIDNLKHGPDGASVLKPELGRTGGAIESIDDQLATLRGRLAEHPAYAGLDDVSKAQLDSAIGDSIKLAHTQYLDDLKHGALAKPVQYVDETGKTFLKDELLNGIDPGDFDNYVKSRGLKLQDVDVSNASPRNYLQRLFEMPDDEADALMRGRGSVADAQKTRTLKTDEQLATGVNETLKAGGKYERNAYKRLLTRSQGQGRMLQKATIAKQILGERFTNLVDGVYKTADNGAQVYDKSVNSAVDEALDAMTKTDPESARALANAYHGLKARGPVLELLAKANRYFKPAAVYGVVIPKMGSIVRNDLGTSWQIMSTQGLKAAGKNLARTPRRMWDAINDGTSKAFGLRAKPGEISRDIDMIEEAFKASKGAEGGVAAHLRSLGRDDLAQAAEHGVLDGFVSMEEIMKKSASSSWWKKKFFDLYDAPGAVFQGVEQRARLANFLDQVRGGKPGADAAAATRESLLDYSVGSTKNRTLRDVIPFAAFLTGSAKQQGKFLAKNPGVAGGLSRALEQDPDQQVYPYMEGKLNIPIGDDAQGNAQFISGFGLPFEALNQIPNPSADLSQFGRQIQRDLVGSSQPLLKSGLSAVFGEDPYFGTPYGSYEKAPIVGNAGDAGRAYNKLAGTGMIQPLDTPLRMIDKAIDPRRNALTKGLDLLTGANVVSVDQDRALQQKLQETLQQSPEVAQYRGFFDKSKDPQTQALLQAYNQVKGRVKAKRQAQEAATAAQGGGDGEDPGSL